MDRHKVDVKECLSKDKFSTIISGLSEEFGCDLTPDEEKLNRLLEVIPLYLAAGHFNKASRLLKELLLVAPNLKIQLVEFELLVRSRAHDYNGQKRIVEQLLEDRDELTWYPRYPWTSEIVGCHLIDKHQFEEGLLIINNALTKALEDYDVTNEEDNNYITRLQGHIADGETKKQDAFEKNKQAEEKRAKEREKRQRKKERNKKGIPEEEEKEEEGEAVKEVVEEKNIDVLAEEFAEYDREKQKKKKKGRYNKWNKPEKEKEENKEGNNENKGGNKKEEKKEGKNENEEGEKNEKKKEVEGKKDLSVKKKEEKEVKKDLGHQEMLTYLDDCKEKKHAMALKRKEKNLMRKGKGKEAKPVKGVEGDNGEGEQGEEAEDDNKEGEVKRKEEEEVKGSDLEINMEEDETEIQGELKLGEAVAVDKGIQDLKYEFEMHIVPQKICDLKTRQSYKGFIKTNAASFPKSFIEAQVPHERNCLDLIQLTCKDLSLLRVEFLMHDDHNCNYLVTEPVDSVESYFCSKLEALSDKPKSNGEWWKRMQDIFWRIFRDVLRGLMFLFDQNLSCGNIAFNVYVTENERGRILPSMEDTKDMKKDLRDLKSIMKGIIQLVCPEDKEDSYLPEDLKAFFDIIGETDFKWKHIPAAFLADYPFFWDCREKVDFTLKTRKLFRKRRDVLEDIDNELELLRVFENWTHKPVGVYYEVFDYASQKNRKGYKSKDDIVRYSYAVFTHVNELDYKSSRNDKFYNDEVIEKELSVYFPDYYRGLFKGLCMCVERGHISADDLMEVCTVYYKQS